MAEADAVLLAKGVCTDAVAPPLTTGAAFTLDEVAAITSEVMGRPVKRVVLPDQVWDEEKVAQGVPASMAQVLLGTFVAARRGDCAATHSMLESLLGRPPLTMRDVLARTQHH